MYFKDWLCTFEILFISSGSNMKDYRCKMVEKWDKEVLQEMYSHACEMLTKSGRTQVTRSDPATSSKNQLVEMYGHACTLLRMEDRPRLHT